MLNVDTLRPTPPDAAQAIGVLLAACRASETAEDVLRQWGQLGFDRAADTRVAGPPGGPLTAYGEVWARDPAEAQLQRFNLGLHVHPELGRAPSAVGPALVAWLEARSREHLAAAVPGADGWMFCSVSGTDVNAQTWLTSGGFRVEGESRLMRIELHAPVPSPVWPAGAALRPLRPESDGPLVYALFNETYSHQSDVRPVPYDRWVTRMSPPQFDPRWWFVVDAPDGSLIAAAQCIQYPHEGWVQSINVHRAWRRQGLALALLHHAFGEFQRAGLPAVELFVDAANATGATRVYDRAGMHIAQRFVRFNKSLAPITEKS